MRTDTLMYNLCDTSTSDSGKFDNFVIVKKQIDVRRIYPAIDNEFRYNIVKVA